MEKIKNFLPEGPQKSLHIDIFRHGEAKYGQKETSIEQADDLTKEGEKEIKERAEELADLIKPGEEIEIWSSPMGRTLHTSKIIAEIFEQKGIDLRKKGDAKESGIKVFEQLSEVKNFSWTLFMPLIKGGEVQFGDKKFIVDKSLTNPDNLDCQEYFIKDGIKNMDPKAKTQLPEDYVKEIEGFEKFMEATKRIMKPLSRLNKMEDKPYRVVIVTHDALTGFIANVFSGGKQGGLNPGEFINLEKKEGKLIATRVGELQKGNKEADIIEEFNNRYSDK